MQKDKLGAKFSIWKSCFLFLINEDMIDFVDFMIRRKTNCIQILRRE